MSWSLRHPLVAGLRPVTTFLCLLGGTAVLHAAPPVHPPPSFATEFTFTLDADYKTSAGVFLNGNLIRTLWRGQSLPAGTYTKEWDNTVDDGSSASSAENYEIRVLYHNVQYHWDGVIGNTSTFQTSTSEVGNIVHRASDQFASLSLASLAGGGTRAYYTAGYNEKQSPFHEFDVDPGDPTLQQTARPIPKPHDGDHWPWTPHSCFHVTFLSSATDGEYVYWANTNSSFRSTSDPTVPQGANVRFVMATRVADDWMVNFPSGMDVHFGSPIPANGNGLYSDEYWASCIDVKFTPGNTPPINTTGIAVQKTGSYLFVAHGDLNSVDVLDKKTGEQKLVVDFGAYGLKAPTQMASKGNQLWVMCQTLDGQTLIQRFTVSSSDGSLSKDAVALSTTALVNPRGFDVSPVANLIVVTDGYPNERVKGFNSTNGLLGATVNSTATPTGRTSRTTSSTLKACRRRERPTCPSSLFNPMGRFGSTTAAPTVVCVTYLLFVLDGNRPTPARSCTGTPGGWESIP